MGCDKIEILNFKLVGPTSPIINGNFEIPIKYKKLNGDIILQFDLFNFTTVSNGQILKTKLPSKLCPKRNTTLKCSTNDAFLLTWTFDNPILPTSAISYFTVNIKKNGKFTISSDTNSLISAGPHSFNAQSIQYQGKCRHFKCKKLKENIIVNTMTVLDANAYPITGTDFNINLTTKKYKNIVVLKIPSFSFTITDTIDPDDPDNPDYALIQGGQLQSTRNFLPKNLRPNFIQTIITSDTQFNVSVDVYGALRISSTNNIAGILNPQTYTLPATSITYLVEVNRKDLIPKNIIIGSGFTNINNLNPNIQSGGLRDLHTNDFYNDHFIFGWNDNSNIASDEDPTSTMFFYVRTGKICNGELKLNPIVNLTSTLVNADNPGYLVISDTSTAINRINPLNMAAAWSVFNVDTFSAQMYTSATMDGLNWSAPFLLISSPGDIDARGLIADKFGNFWYVFNQANIGVPGLYIYTSSTGGSTWNPPVFIPVPANAVSFDYPQLAIGNNGSGDYGLFIQVDQIITYDVLPQIYFFPATGLGKFNSNYQVMTYPNLNQCAIGTITTKEDGTLFINSLMGLDLGINFYVNSIFRKAPGALDPLLLTGPYTAINGAQCLVPTNSFPVPGFSYFPISEYSIIYDNCRKVLYVFFQERPQVNSQDIHLFLVISFDEGNSFSKRYPIASSHKNNRGFSSASLDTKTGSILVGFYDSRNSPNSIETQYFTSYLCTEKLNKIVEDARIIGTNKKLIK
jgi:hypothetical protein